MFEYKRIDIDTNHNFVIILRDKDAEKLSLKSGDRVKVFPTNRKSVSIVCELEILSCSKEICDITLKKEQVGIVNNVYNKLKLKKNDRLSLVPADKPKSIECVRQKFLGKKKLNEEDFRQIMENIISNSYSNIETTFFVLACTVNPLDDNETIALTKAMVSVGKEINFRKKKDEIIVDKHCIGGIPGNRTTMVVIPIIAAAGLKIPKTSSRSITSPSGTADTMEVLANVSLDINTMHKVVTESGGCVVWGGGLDLSPADDIIINVEHPLEIDSEGQMIASILSKKKSVGSTHILLDIPVGETAKVKTKLEALRLKKRFEKVGKAIGMNVRVILTDGSQPIGRGIGPALEAKDVMRVLNNDSENLNRLREKAIFMAGELLEMGGVTKKGLGMALAKNILESGDALAKFEEIIHLQGSNGDINSSKYSFAIKSKVNGTIKSINNKRISKLAFVLGAPKDKEAGVYIHRRVGDKVKKGDIIYEIHSNSNLKLKYGITYLEEFNPYLIK